MDALGSVGSAVSDVVGGNNIVSNTVNDAVSIASNMTDIQTIHDTLMLLVGLATCLITRKYPKSVHVPDKAEYDFIIAGGGSAGSVMARRLVDIGNFHVLLVEAGGDPPPQAACIPGLFILLTHSPQDWDNHARNDGKTCQAQNNAQMALTRGKMLGGCSCLSHLIYARGSSQTFDDWEAMGNEGWNWENCFEYFKRIEDIQDPKILKSDTLKYHGQGGPMQVTPATSHYFLKKEDSMLDSFADLGTGVMSDTNIPNPMGRGRFIYQVTAKESYRSCVANSYLVGTQNKGKLHVIKNTLVSKVLFEDKTAKGVELTLASGSKIEAYAKKEVILSAGAYHSPQILLVSGVGPKEDLEKLGISVVLDQPKVGKNLMDHVHAPIAAVGQLSAAASLETVVSLTELKTFPLPMVTSLFNVNKEPTVQPPEIQTISLNFGAASPLLYYLCHITFNFNKTVCNSYFKDSLLREIYYTLTILTDPASRGEVTIKSADVKDQPIVDYKFFSNKTDLITLSKAVKKMHDMHTKYYKKVGGHFSRPPLAECDDLEFDCDEYWLCYTRIMGSTTYHPAGTCAMGPDGVTDSDLKVRGLKNIRVVDASIIPKLTTGKLEATVLMIAEYAADKIIKQYGCAD